MESRIKHETKSCPRCGVAFECKVGSITECQCMEIQITQAEMVKIRESYEDCLCISCLKEMKSKLFDIQNQNSHIILPF